MCLAYAGEAGAIITKAQARAQALNTVGLAIGREVTSVRIIHF